MSLVRIGDVESVWDDLVGIYKECWAHSFTCPTTPRRRSGRSG
ncbi:hypothetical protein SAZ11_35170 [Streptomyces sp. FXJ1.4098]|nr:hypothetical protein [Streptomyces sp. FXJ1.4098]